MKCIANMILALALTGCYLDYGPHPGDALKPVGPDGWADVVTDAADTWALVLGDECPRYTVDADDPDAKEVRLLPSWLWPYPTGALGVYSAANGRIDIQGTMPEEGNKVGRLVHELGHGIGLEHNNELGSVMNIDDDWTGWPSAGDIELAQELLGCSD